MSSLWSNKLILFFFTSISATVSSAENLVIAPQCPKNITITNNQPIAPKGWQVSLASRYIEAPNKYQLKDGSYQTESIAPQISYIHNERSQKVRLLLPDDEHIIESEESYSWKLDKEKIWVFICDAEGKIFLYQIIDQPPKKCSLIIKLENGEKSWGNQKLECSN